MPDSSPPIGASWAGSGKGTSSLLGCLVIAARYRNVQLSTEQLVHDHLLPPGEPSIDTFMKIVAACGLRAVLVRLTFGD